MPSSLAKGFFQRAYVTNDLERAITDFGNTYGVHNFLQMRDIPFVETGTTIHIALAYVGADMIELIQPVGDVPLYSCLLPNQGYALRFHHCGHLLSSEEDWTAMTAEVARQGLAIPLQGDSGGMFRYLYADTRERFGHFLEFIYCTPEGTKFFTQVPQN